MDILERCKGKHDVEVDSRATDFEGLTKDVDSFVDSIEEHERLAFIVSELTALYMGDETDASLRGS